MIDGMDARARAAAEATHITACGLHHGACRASRAAEIPHPRAGRCGHGRDAAGRATRPCGATSTNCATISSCLTRCWAWARCRSSTRAACLRARRFCICGITCPTGARTGAAGMRPSSIMRDRMLAHLSKFVANIPGCVLQGPYRQSRWTWSAPAQASGAATCTASPMPRIRAARIAPRRILGRYTVPGLERFYLVGPFQHPGGGVFGAGRATAMKMFEALGMDFEKQGRVK